MKEKKINQAFGYMTVLLWNDEIKEAINLFGSFFNSEELQREVNVDIINILLMFLAKKQYNFAYKVFQENKYDIRDKYKLVYSALLSLMGDELKESVRDVLERINSIEEDFTEDKGEV
jgi:hypothetical protein